MNRKKIVASLLFAILCGNFITLMAQNKMDAQGRRQGKWVKVDKNNRKIYEGNFVDGYEVGLFTYYYSDGTVRIKNNFWDKGKMCSHEAYDAKGNLMAKGFYNQKNKDSVWHLYNDKGILLKTISYKMGTKTGPSVLLDKTGDTLEVQTWNDDKKHGKWYRRLSNNGYITAEYATPEARTTRKSRDGRENPSASRRRRRSRADGTDPRRPTRTAETRNSLRGRTLPSPFLNRR